MTLKDIWALSLAAACGFLGGTAANPSKQAKAAAPDTVRAARFELVDQSGHPISVWERDHQGRAVLAFEGKHGNQTIVLGLRPDASPFLDMEGPDGRPHMTLRLDARGRPLLGMGDESWEGRVLLGFVAPDTPSKSDDWGLLFRAPGSGTLASIGVVSDSTGARSGGLFVRTGTGEVWHAVPR